MRVTITSARILRRIIQIGVIALIVLAAHDGAYRKDILRNSRHLQDAFSPDPTAYGTLLDRHDRLDQGLDSIRGNVWFFDLGFAAFADSLAVVENLAVSRGLPISLIIAGAALLVLTLACGRVFCSHLCPAALLFDIGGVIRQGLLRLGVELPSARVPRYTKYMVLGIGLAAAALSGQYILTWIYPPRLVCVELDRLAFNGALRFGTFFLLGVMLVEILVFPRIWCTHLCPGGALYSLLGARRLLRIKLHAGRCTHCGACRSVCPYDLEPDKASPGMECDNCVRCIASCPEDALTYRRPEYRAPQGGDCE